MARADTQASLTAIAYRQGTALEQDTLQAQPAPRANSSSSSNKPSQLAISLCRPCASPLEFRSHTICKASIR
jgi:hypothetical protein